MKIHSKFTALGVTIALSAAPALVLAAPSVASVPSKAHHSHSSTPGPKASSKAKAKAYGKYCQTESKKHVAGTPGTPFSKCVTDMAKLANGSSTNPHKACKNESKKHVAGTPGTAYSKCVSGAKKLLKSQSSSSSSSS